MIRQALVFTFTLAACLGAQSTVDNSSEPVVLRTATGPIYGTLELSSCKSKCPVAIIIAGSGPTDRDGNSAALPGKNNSLKMLAEALAANGIASIRYDKRGIAESAKSMQSEDSIRFTDYVRDAGEWIDFARKDPRFASVIVVGHSEGSLIGIIAAQTHSVDKFVSLAGTGRPAGTVILEQLSGQLPPDLMASAEGVVRALNAGKVPDSVPPVLYSLFRPSVVPYLISWMKYDPAAEIAKLKIPSLVVQGTTDIQVSRTDANLLAAANPMAKLVVIEGMNHVFKDAPSDRAAQISAYSNPNLPLNAQLVREVVQFINGS